MSGASEKLYYFAYGSNMAPQRLRARVPSAEPLQRALLPRHQLRFHKHSRVDGSAKCDACHTGDAGHNVHGMLYRMAAEDKSALDRAEGLGHGYEIKQVTLLLADATTFEAFTYYATDIDPQRLPYDWYLEHVLRGARYAGLPADYLDALARIESMNDPDAQRRERELALYG